MKQKIFRNTFLLSLFVLVLCAVLFFGLMFGQIKEHVFTELRTEAAYVAAGLEGGEKEYLASVHTDRRITIVEPDGSVSYDNRADPAGMANHLDRSEIAEAMESGSGRSIHYSGTLMETTLYYAYRLSDGSVLRVSAPYESFLSLLTNSLRPLLAALIAVLLLCFFIASRLSRQITEPINAIDLKEPGNNHLYPELEPLVQRLRQQNRTIRSQMEELSRKTREFAAITENMSEGLLLVGSGRKLLFANNFASALIGGTGKSLVRASCPQPICDSVDSALSGKRSESLYTAGERIYQLICSPVLSGGSVSGAALLILDVTEREKRDELRREFSANVSHELKTPLTSISGFAELMKEGLVSGEKMREFSEDIYKESRRMINLVEDIIRLSGLDEGREDVERESVEMLSLCKKTVSQLASFAESSGIKVEVSGEEGFVLGSSALLGEMVYNLCENAIKYNRPGGSVELHVDCLAEKLRLSVRDTGIGIPMAHQGRIFERFYRVDKSHSRATGGTGLGLSIVRRGAMFHEAAIELKSEEGVGSEFILTFPKEDKDI